MSSRLSSTSGPTSPIDSVLDAKELIPQNELPSLKASPKSAPSRKRLVLIAAGAFTVAAILALALGLGLGLGLKHKSSSNANTTAVMGTVQSQDSSAFVMDMSMVNEAPTTRYYDWVLDERIGSPDGVQKNMLVVNGISPGPTIEANEGDRIIVNVTNNMVNATSIHWHGIYQRGTNYYDGTAGITQCGIPPGQSMVYNFTMDDWVGSTWWHAHYETQYTDGLTGAIVVHAKNESVPAYDGDLVIQVGDLYHDFSGAVLNYYFTPQGIDGVPGNEPVPDGGLINGVGQYGSSQSSFFNATLEANKTYRLRIINTGSFVAMRFSVDNHILTVVEGDGTAVTPIPVTGVSAAIAQRYSVLLTTNQTAGAYFIRAGLDTTAFNYNNPGVQTEIRGVIRYGDGVANDTLPDMSLLNNPPALPAGSPGDLNQADLTPVNGGPAPNATVQSYFTISMQYPAGQSYLGEYLAFVNATSWTPLTTTSTLFSRMGNTGTDDSSTTYNNSQLITTVDEVQTVQIVVDNLDDSDHPFHLHGYKFWVMDQGEAGRYQGSELNNTLTNTNPMMRDTLIFPAYTHSIIRFQADNPGVWAFHCHIAWHMAAGLLYQFDILPSQSANFDIPQYMLDQCSMQ